MRRGWLIVGLMALVASASAQSRWAMGRTEIVLGGGGMGYVGDLNNQSVFEVPGLSVAGGVRYRIDNRWALQGEVGYGRIGCDKDYIARRNLSFRSDIVEATFTVQFNFRPFGMGGSEARWTPYIYGGLGAFHFCPEAEIEIEGEGRRWVELEPLGTEGQYLEAYPDRGPYRLMQLCFPFGVGVRVKLNKTFSLTAEYGFRKTWTDYLDDVSTTYVGSAALTEGEPNGVLAARLADRSGEVEGGSENAAGIKRGDDSLDDWYTCFRLSVGVSLETLLGWTRSKKCD
ncbi:MAG: outer membrane beta-barrel protein [Bacteroidales bacterium]|nr:outer membrane beta-barrel protein [Bacteroidales bacterium]